jgi:hypothetical protein
VFDDGSSQYLQNANALITDEPFTFAIWFNTDDDTNNQVLLSVTDQNGNHRIQLQAAGSAAGDPVRAYMEGTSVQAGFNATSGYSTNTWHHAAMRSASGTDHAVYIDGGSKGTDSSDRGAYSGLDVTSIGVSEYTGGLDGLMSGKLAHGAIWNVALTDAEILRLANGALPTEIRECGSDRCRNFKISKRCLAHRNQTRIPCRLLAAD